MSSRLTASGLQSSAGLFGQCGVYEFDLNASIFNPQDLNPYLLFDAETSMKGTGDNAANFLEGVSVFKNLSTGSNAGGDAVQTTALRQPLALPLIKDSNGVLGGYLYQPDVTGNAPAVNIPSIAANEDFVFEMEVYLVNATNFHLASGSDANHRFGIYNNGFYFSPEAVGLTSPLSTGASTLTVERSGTTATLKQNGVTKATHTANISDNTYTFTHLSFNGQFGTSIGRINGYIKKATLSIEGTQVFNCDFTATNVRHGDTKFKCATGQVVTVNQSGNDPATIIKKSVLRFDGTNDFLSGVFNQTITGSSIFMAYSVVGEGEASGRLLGLNSTGANDNVAGGYFLAREGSTTNVMARYNGGTNIVIHAAMYDDAVGDVLLEANIKNGSQISKINNANKANGTTTVSGDLSSEEFKIACFTSGDPNAAIDLEFLALFNPDSIPDEKTAQRIRNYINGRGAHPIFTLIDSDAFYFYDGTKSPVGAISSGSSAWSGRVVGSDNGDSASLLGTQATSNDAPVGDGFKVTFADNTDHIDIPSISQSGWQICGTSLGTFVYKINGTTAVTELNLLGNLGNASYRQVGDLYGVILLPASATGADLQEARKLLIDRGSEDGVAPSDCSNFWRGRVDIINFKNISFNSVTNITSAWRGNSAMTTFTVSFPSVTQASNAFLNCSSLSDFGTTDLKNCVNFSNAWKSCSALTSFPAGAKLGTAATNVNFSSAWQDSGLKSFPAGIDLSKGAVFNNAFNSCTSLSSFPSINLSQGTHFSFTWYNTAMTEFPYISFEKARTFYAAWYINNSLVDFASGCFDDWNPDSIENNCFNFAFKINNLSSQSVENILVSIDSSGQHATTDGTSNTNPITGTNIDLKYNTATGSLSAATNTAVSSLKGRGWSIIVNNVTL